MKKIYIPQGGGRDFWLRIPMNNESAGRHLCMDDVDENDMHVWLESGYGGCWTLVWEKDGAQRDGIAAKVPASQLGYGTYSVVMAGKFVNGDYFRTKRQLFIRLVDREDQADAEPTMYNEEQAYWAGPAVLSEMLSRDGLNTYELAVIHGFEGTLEEFLAQAGIELQDLMVTKPKLSREVQTQLDRGSEKAITPRGDYDEDTEYQVNDLVYDSETMSSYVSLTSVNIGNPVTDEDYWMKVLDGDHINDIERDAEALLANATEAANNAAASANLATSAAEAVVAQKVAQAQVGYYTCNTQAGTATKATTSNLAGDSQYSPASGGAVKIKMTAANTSTDTVYLQFGSDTNTKKPLFYNGLAVDASNTWEDNEVISVYFDPSANSNAGAYFASNAQGGGGKAEKIKYDNSQSGLSAENVQGALDEVGDELMYEGDALIFGNPISYRLNNDGVWITQESNHYLSNVNPGDKIKVTANSNGSANLRWLTSNEAPQNNHQAPVSLIDPTPYDITAGESMVLTAPSDANYLYALGLHAGVEHKPASVVKMESVKDTVINNKENIAAITKTSGNDISRNVQWTLGFVNSDGSINSSSTTRAYSSLIDSHNNVSSYAAEGYVLRYICYYNNEGVFQSRNWFNVPPTNYSESYNGYIRIGVSKSDNSDLTVADAANNISVYRSDENGVSSINDISGNKIEYHRVSPRVEQNMILNFSGNIVANTSPLRRLWWYPMEKGDTVKVILNYNDGVTTGNMSCAFYKANTPSTSLTDNSRLWYRSFVAGTTYEIIYTAEDDGIIAFTYADTAYSSASILIHYGEDAGMGKAMMPKISCGTQIMSRPEDTYCHAPMVRMNDNYLFICYHGGNTKTTEVVNNTSYVVLLVINKRNGRSKYIRIFDYSSPDYINGNVCSEYYNHSTVLIGSTNSIMIRTGCQCGGKWMEVYKIYNADTDTLSDIAVQQLNYNGNTVEFNMGNYITMVNTLYGTTFDVIQFRPTNEINDICYYNNKYYCVMALVCHNVTSIPQRFIKCPHIFAVSNDAITWTPIANVTDDYYSAETLLTIVNDIVYYAFRSDRLGEFYMVFDMQGNILRAPEPTTAPLSKVWSKPAITYSGGRVLIGFNKVHDDSIPDDPSDQTRMKYSYRTKMCIAEISQTAPYGITEYKTYVSANGWNYYHFAPKKNGNILVVNVEDSRGLNDNIHQVVTDVNICEVDMLELTSNE